MLAVPAPGGTCLHPDEDPFATGLCFSLADTQLCGRRDNSAQGCLIIAQRTAPVKLDLIKSHQPAKSSRRLGLPWLPVGALDCLRNPAQGLTHQPPQALLQGRWPHGHAQLAPASGDRCPGAKPDL